MPGQKDIDPAAQKTGLQFFLQPGFVLSSRRFLVARKTGNNYGKFAITYRIV